MHRTLIAALALLMTAAPALAEEPRDAFDIVCIERVSQRMRDAAGKPIIADQDYDREQRISLDVTGNRWCDSTQCATRTGPFVERDGDVLVLGRSEDGGSGMLITYTRSTKRYAFRMPPKADGSGLSITIDGVCRVEPFTGPPPSPAG
jgi:hypothetical protein